MYSPPPAIDENHESNLLSPIFVKAQNARISNDNKQSFRTSCSNVEALKL